MALGALALFIRFYKLTTLSVWPHFDEGRDNYFAFEFSQRWDGRLFYGCSQATPLFTWTLGFVLKLIPPSLGTLWSFPALISFLTLPAGYGASRQFFSKSFSFLILLLLAFNFWSFYTGRFSFLMVLILFWECVVLYLWGSWRRATSLHQGKRLVLLGAGLGFGFYIYPPSWLVISTFFGITLLYVLFRRPGKRLVNFSLWGVPFLVLCFPLLVAALRQGYGQYFWDLFSLSSGKYLGFQLSTAVHYLSCLFWGLGPEFHAYQPFWGGFLNPILGSLFLLGSVELLKNPRAPFYPWLGTVLVFFFLPALLTPDMEPFRLLAMLPILLVVTALGWVRLSLHLPKSKAIGISVLLLATSLGLDFYHLAGPYHHNWDKAENWRNCLKSIERSRAYEILKKISKERGPGLIFSDFVPGNSDQTLTIADFNFNSSINPGLSPQDARWLAVLANIHYQPFLSKRFSGSKTYYLSKDLTMGDGGLMLWVAPLAPQQWKEVVLWQKASRALGPYIDLSLSYVHGKSYQPVLDSLVQVHSAFEGDPFLRSVYWEKVADSQLKMGHKDHQDAIQAVQESLRSGYPSAHLYYDLGAYYLMDNNRLKAREAFQKAAQSPFDFTSSQKLLEGLK